MHVSGPLPRDAQPTLSIRQKEVLESVIPGSYEFHRCTWLGLKLSPNPRSFLQEQNSTPCRMSMTRMNRDPRRFAMRVRRNEDATVA